MNYQKRITKSLSMPSSNLLNSFLHNGNQKYLRFYIGSGAMVMKDRCVPMEAVSSVLIKETPDPPLVQAIVYIVTGFVLYHLSEAVSYYLRPVITIVGTLFLVLGFVMFVSAILLLMGKRYMLRVNMNNGQWIEYSTKKSGFPEQVLEAFCECIENKDTCFVVDFSSSTIKREPKRNVAGMFQNINNYYGNNHINNGNINVYNGDTTVMKNTGGVNIAGDNNGEANLQACGLRQEEWDRLISFFDRQSALASDMKTREEYEKMKTFSEKKDGKGLVKFLASIGKSAAQKVITALAEQGLQQLLVTIYQAVR